MANRDKRIGIFLNLIYKLVELEQAYKFKLLGDNANKLLVTKKLKKKV
jgi:hypothetical protein